MKWFLTVTVLLGIACFASADPGDVVTINTISPKNYPNAFLYIVRSTDVFVSTLTFTKNLGPADVNLQHAMNTIDQISTSSGSGSGTITQINAGTGISVTNSTGPVVTVTNIGTCIPSGQNLCLYQGGGAYFTFDGTNFCLWVNSVEQQCWSHAVPSDPLELEAGGDLLLEDGTKLLLEQ